MPEGDTIHRTARGLKTALVGAPITQANARDASVAVDLLVDRTTTQVEPRGKHLLMHLDDGQVIHSHMGMTGSWHVYRRGRPWRKPARRAALVLGTAVNDVVCFSPKTLELLPAGGLARHRHLRRLGPDLLADTFDTGDALARLRTQDRAPIGEAIMNQTAVCGIGNVYKSETLFLEGLDPFAPVGTFADDTVLALLGTARRLMQTNMRGYPRTTRVASDGHKVWVYGRHGQRCLKCGETVRMRRQGDQGRSTYGCPRCQPESKER